MLSDVQKMIIVGLIWGTTNSLMGRGAKIWNRKLSSSPPSRYLGPVGQLRKWADLISIYHYSIPFIVNLCASAGFFYMLGDAPVSVAVPVTNATTFAATALSGMVLGEEMRVGLVMIGTSIIVLGVWICVM